MEKEANTITQQRNSTTKKTTWAIKIKMNNKHNQIWADTT